MKRSLGLWKRPYAGVNHLVLALAMLLSRHLRRIESLPPKSQSESIAANLILIWQIVGLGNWYYPLSRESVGLYALERYAQVSPRSRLPPSSRPGMGIEFNDKWLGQRYSLVWDFIPNICSDALASKTGIALIKPKTYQQKGTSCHPCS